jgi:D-beta-D-heptose 7-phosphate kinase/D-beta-D-heptose 1-phosphate adenosyltransferase
MELLQRFVNCLEDKTRSVFIHIVGDSMIDEDYQVKVTRISPECPNVNILLSGDDKPFRKFPGGAANVCYQLNNFNVVNRLFTFTDGESYNIFKEHGITRWGNVNLPYECKIPRKRRFYEKGFQVVDRWDIEKSQYGLENGLLEYFQNELYKNWLPFQAEPEAIIFSDYNKGIFSNEFNLSCFDTKAITVVDPKAAPLEKWKGCTVFKPNSKEAEVLSGLKDWKLQCDFFQQELGCRGVVITQEGDGVVGKEELEYFEYRPNHSVKPLDIIGAGDCFISMLTLALVYNFSLKEAAQIAFHGGLMYVQQKQRGMFGPWSFHSTGKIIKNLEVLKDRNYKLAFTNGCFDLIHSGHLHTLEYAKSKGDKLVIAVNSDASIKRLKGDSRPILPLAERMKLLAALDCVDFVISFEEDTPLKLIEAIKPDVLVKGSDWIDKEVAGSNCVKEMCYVPLVEGHSTSEIIKKIKSL